MQKHASMRPEAAPLLPKEWKGTVTVTGIGATSRQSLNHPHHVGAEKHVPGWNADEQPRTLRITRQEGRHLEAVVQSPGGHEHWVIGTLSADGKQIQAATEGGVYMFTLSGDTMSGSGSGRGTDGGFDHWLRDCLTAWYDFKAVK